ncbi:MAG: hypothetical protein Q4F21_12810 [Lachnospiraceae bacterium]|nr:hypothetical protein [Lachnospiraceae bacterium]
MKRYGSRRAAYIIAVLVITVCFCSIVYKLLQIDAAPWQQSFFGQSDKEVSLHGYRIEMPEYISAEDAAEGDYSEVLEREGRGEEHIRMKHLEHMVAVFAMLISPALLFMLLIRLFGRWLARIWHVISYIHQADGKESCPPKLRIEII